MTGEISTRFEQVSAEWAVITQRGRPDPGRFAEAKREADRILAAGRWVSGPADLLSVLGRQRDELTHSRTIAWLLTPTGRHALGTTFLRAVLDRVWPGDGLLRSGHVTVEVERTRSAADDAASMRAARADIVVAGDGATVVIENKVDAEEGSEQCERLYWSWADQPTETRWLFLSPTGRSPVTATSPAATTAWRTMSYRDLQDLLRDVLEAASERPGDPGRLAAHQYLATLTSIARR